MNFARFLHERRSLHMDHRHDASAADAGAATATSPRARGGGGRRAPQRPERGRFRHVKPVFPPSLYAEPLPYIEPWERS